MELKNSQKVKRDICKIKNSKELKKINFKLSKISEENKLNSVDNTILALMIMAIGIIFTLISMISESKITWFSQVILAIIIIWSISGIQLFIEYLRSIFFEENKFSSKVFVISTALTILSFMILAIGIPLTLDHFKVPSTKTFIIILQVTIIAVPFVLWNLIKSKVLAYFVKNFPIHFYNSIKKMNKEQRIKELKKIKITYSELKKSAEYF